MRTPSPITVEMIKGYTKDILDKNNNDTKLLFTSKSSIEHRKGDFVPYQEILKELSKQHFVKEWEVTSYLTIDYLAEDGFKCYELIPNLNHWDSVLIILPPNPSQKQKEEWGNFKEKWRNFNK